MAVAKPQVQAAPAAPVAEKPKASSAFYIPVSFAPFQRLVGGVPRATVTALVGPPEAGKTTLAVQVGLDVVKQAKKNFLVFDTETSLHSYLALVDAFETLFDAPINLVKVDPIVKQTGPKDKPVWTVSWKMTGAPNKDAINIFNVYCPDIMPILILHGRGARIEVSPESGKVKVELLAGAQSHDIRQTAIAKFIEEHNIGLVLYDSLTNPFDEFPAVGENFPARADMTQLLMIQVQKLACVLDVPILATVHESTNPINAFNPALKVEGGKGIGYNLKFVLYIMKGKNNALLPGGSALKNKLAPLPFKGRYLFNMRHPREAGWQRVEPIELTDKGFVPLDVTGMASPTEE